MWPTFYIPWSPLQSPAGVVTVLTTRPYPIEILDKMESGLGGLRWVPWIPSTDEMESIIALANGELRTALIIYPNWPAEQIESALALDSATLRAALITYTNWADVPAMVAAERIESAMVLVSGTLVAALVSYINWPTIVNDERLASSMTLSSGTLT